MPPPTALGRILVVRRFAWPKQLVCFLFDDHQRSKVHFEGTANNCYADKQLSGDPSQWMAAKSMVLSVYVKERR